MTWHQSTSQVKCPLDLYLSRAALHPATRTANCGACVPAVDLAMGTLEDEELGQPYKKETCSHPGAPHRPKLCLGVGHDSVVSFPLGQKTDCPQFGIPLCSYSGKDLHLLLSVLGFAPV